MSKIFLIIISIFVFILYTTFTNSVLGAYQLGVSPSFIDAGELRPGSTKFLHFFITTQSEDDSLVRLDSEPVNLDFFKKPGFGKYLQNYSEQDTTGWIEFINNPVNLEYSPIDKDSGQINRWRKVNFILKIPKDAEPGYHAIALRLTPQIAQGYGTTFNIVSLTTAVVLVKVPGEAIRAGKILDITIGDFVGERLRLNTIFQNTGTVTITARVHEINIYDEDEHLEKLKSIYGKVAPGDVINLETLYRPNMDPGEYKIDSSVFFTTGSVFKEATIYIGKPTITLTEPKEDSQPIGIEWLFIPIIIVVAYLIYRRGSD